MQAPAGRPAPAVAAALDADSLRASRPAPARIANRQREQHHHRAQFSDRRAMLRHARRLRHGPASMNATDGPRAPPPRHAVAGRSPGHVPVHAARVSDAASQFHSGSAGCSCDRSRPASEKSGAQSTGAACIGCLLTLRRDRLKVREPSLVIELHLAHARHESAADHRDPRSPGVSRSVWNVDAPVSGSGLCRYQNSRAARAAGADLLPQGRFVVSSATAPARSCSTQAVASSPRRREEPS